MSNYHFDVLKERNSLFIFLSQMITSVADKMLSLGLIWYITKSIGANHVSWFLACAFLPHLVFSFFSTRIIHYLGTIKTMVTTTIFRSMVLFVYFLLLVTDVLKVEHLHYSLFTMVFLIGVGTSLFTPAILSSPPLLVPENKIIALNGLLDSTLSISSILGAVLSVFLLNFVDLQGLILINAICFLFAFFLQLGLKKISIENLDDNQKEPHVSPITVLKKYPDIAKMLLSFLILNLILAPIFVLIPWYVDNVYKGDSSSLSIIEGAMGLGAFLMGIVISITKFEVKEKDRVKMIAVISFIFGICFTLFSQTIATYQAAVILFLFGSFLTFLNIQVLTYFQTEASEGDVPAIMTSVNLISNAAMPLSLSLSGIVFPLVDVKQLALFSGIIIILISFVMPTIIRGKSQ